MGSVFKIICHPESEQDRSAAEVLRRRGISRLEEWNPSLSTTRMQARWSIRLMVSIWQSLVQDWNLATGIGTRVKASFDSLAKCIYTWSDEGRDRFLPAL